MPHISLVERVTLGDTQSTDELGSEQMRLLLYCLKH